MEKIHRCFSDLAKYSELPNITKYSWVYLTDTQMSAYSEPRHDPYYKISPLLNMLPRMFHQCCRSYYAVIIKIFFSRGTCHWLTILILNINRNCLNILFKWMILHTDLHEGCHSKLFCVFTYVVAQMLYGRRQALNPRLAACNRQQEIELLSFTSSC